MYPFVMLPGDLWSPCRVDSVVSSSPLPDSRPRTEMFFLHLPPFVETATERAETKARVREAVHVLLPRTKETGKAQTQLRRQRGLSRNQNILPVLRKTYYVSSFSLLTCFSCLLIMTQLSLESIRLIFGH